MSSSNKNSIISNASLNRTFPKMYVAKNTKTKTKNTNKKLFLIKKSKFDK